MKSISRIFGLVVAFGGCASYSSICFAQTSTFTDPSNPSKAASVVSPSTLPVTLIPVHMSKQRMEALSMIMHSDHNSCFLEDLQPDDDSSMLVICGVQQSVFSIDP